MVNVGLSWSLLDVDGGPLDLELLRKDHRYGGKDSLAELRLFNEHRYLAFGVDAKPSIWRQDWRRCFDDAAGGCPAPTWQVESNHQPRRSGRSGFEKCTPAQHCAHGLPPPA